MKPVKPMNFSFVKCRNLFIGVSVTGTKNVNVFMYTAIPNSVAGSLHGAHGKNIQTCITKTLLRRPKRDFFSINMALTPRSFLVSTCAGKYEEIFFLGDTLLKPLFYCMYVDDNFLVKDKRDQSITLRNPLEIKSFDKFYFNKRVTIFFFIFIPRQRIKRDWLQLSLQKTIVQETIWII